MSQSAAECRNTVSYPTRPRWTFTFKVRGEYRERAYNVAREVEARSRLAADEPDAYDIEAIHDEIPL